MDKDCCHCASKYSPFSPSDVPISLSDGVKVYVSGFFEGGKAGGRVTELQREPYRVAGWSPAQHRGSFLIICYQRYQVWLQGISLIREEKTQQAPALLSHQTL